MKQPLSHTLVAAAILFLASRAGAGSAPANLSSAQGMEARDRWVRENLADPRRAAPFSFTYDGRPSGKILAGWSSETSSRRLDAIRTEQVRTWSDPRTGLQVRCVAVKYSDYPAEEWTIYFKNLGARDTPILESIQGLDVTFHSRLPDGFILNGIKGDWCVAASYEPYQLPLGKNQVEAFTPSVNIGKSSSGPRGWPYFNLQVPGGGVIVAVGWPGQWAGSFVRDNADGLRVIAGQQLTHLVLRPGEQIRTPLIALLFWRGADMVAAQNLWRRWLLADNVPRTDGRTQTTIAQVQVEATEANTDYVDSFLKAGIRPDLCWMDAGWYTNRGAPFKDKLAWLNTGTWEFDPVRFPRGFKPFSDWVHAHGMQFIVWFEPERVGDPQSWLGLRHPEWLLPCSDTGALLDEGNPEAQKWLTEHVDNIVKTQGLDWYREDMNGDGPLPGWRRHDAEDRQGITENLYVQGHLAYWDELRRRNPHLRIDSCASGGRRNDLETLRRAVPLLRSDFQWPEQKQVVEGNQAQTYGLSSWLPFYGTGAYFYDKYSYRSFFMASFGMGQLTPENADAQREAYAECARVGPCMLGDYYPLTPYSLAVDQWIAWQFNRPESGDGLVQAFRRSSNQVASQTFRLQGLEPAAWYEITNLDLPGSKTESGEELMREGLSVEISGAPGSAVLLYKRKSD